MNGKRRIDYFDQVHRDIDAAVARGRREIRASWQEGPCGCLFALEEMPHTHAEHARTSCGGVTFPEPCGGCYDCLCAQLAYYKRKEQEDGR